MFYGYKMVEGTIIPDEEQAQKVRQIFSDYASGLSLKQVGDRSGLGLPHTSIGLMLRNERYTGNGIYPRLIDPDLFQKVQERREKRGRSHRRGPKEKPARHKAIYKLDYVPKRYDDPYLQAEYAYSLIKTVEVNNEGKGYSGKQAGR